ncbi:MAG: Bax inhibitor-1/YccA family protein [Planctomycetota bacterium]|jgi:FtsH-binding integral membrane protein
MRRFAEHMGWVADRGGFAIDAAVDERLGFLRKTYGLLCLQILAVGAISALLIQNEALLAQIANFLFGNIFVYLAIVIGLPWLTRSMLAGDKPLRVQYTAVGLWVVFLSCLVAPICYFAADKTGSYQIVGEAFLITIAIFGGLTAYVLTTRKDFSMLRGALWMGALGLFAIALISAFMGAAVGIWYSIAWVILLAGWTLYDTSQVLHKRPVTQAVAASVDLLVDFVLMFLYIVMILMRSRD